MPRRAAIGLVAALCMAAAGCGFWGKGRGEPDAAREVLGIEDREGRFRETTLEDVEQQLSRPKNGLRLTIRTSKEVYDRDEPIVLDVRLRNVSGVRPGDKGRDIPVYFEVFAQMPNGRRAPWLLKPTLRSEATGNILYRVPDYEVPEEQRKKLYHYVVLPPEAYVGYTFTFPPNWLRPGRTFSFICSYEVSDDYPYVIRNRNLSPEQVELLGLKLAYARVWTGRLHSNRAQFRIRRKKFLGMF